MGVGWYDFDGSVNVDPADINSLDFVNLLGNAISGLNPDDIDKLTC
ncbi:MAG: hypothetical protein ACLTZT_04925 [Butyricimonas faecalis]